MPAVFQCHRKCTFCCTEMDNHWYTVETIQVESWM